MGDATSDSRRDKYLAYLGYSLVLAVFLALATLFGVLYRSGPAEVSLLWLTSGVATAGLLLLGPRYWPAVLLATFGSAALFGLAPAQAGLLAAGTACGAGLAVTAMRALITNAASLDSLRHLFYLTTIGALANSMVLATFAALGARVLRLPTPAALTETWLLWWLAGVNGILLIVPLVLSLAKPRISRAVRSGWLGYAMLLLVTALLSSAVYGNPGMPFGKSSLSLQLAIFPLIVWGGRCVSVTLGSQASPCW